MVQNEKRQQLENKIQKNKLILCERMRKLNRIYIQIYINYIATV